MDIQLVRKAYAEIEKGTGVRKIARFTATVVAMAASVIPVAGGPASIAFDKLGNLFSPDVEQHLAAVERTLIALAPEIDKIDDLRERIRAITGLLERNAQVLEAVQTAVSVAAEQVLDPLTIRNVGGIQVVRDVVIDHMRLEASASDKGVNTFENLRHTGTARFDTDHDRQEIIGSHFSGRSGGFSTETSIPRAVLGQGTVEHHVSKPEKFSALRVTRIIGPDDPGGATLTVSTVVGPTKT